MEEHLFLFRLFRFFVKLDVVKRPKIYLGFGKSAIKKKTTGIGLKVAIFIYQVIILIFMFCRLK